MRKIARTFVACVACLVAASALGQNATEQSVQERIITRTIHIPDSSVERSADLGVRAHTNHMLGLGPQAIGAAPTGETPQSIYPVYGLSFTASGGNRAIAIVDAFDYPTAENDLNVFSTQFGLPTCTTANGCFKLVFARGTRPAANCGWGQEAALDIEWAHAMAPSARIIFVEAASNSFADLLQAVDVATAQVQAAGGGEVSMSWGGSEFSGENANDTHFQGSGVVYFASSGDTGGVVIYPSASPFVVSAGGTTIHRSTARAFLSETGWSGSGGGPSAVEPRPNYQIGVANASSTRRSTPDFSFDADPNSGVSVYDSTVCSGNGGWMVFGGTSVSAPSLAGIVNHAGSFFSSSNLELSIIYANFTNTSEFRDILTGRAGRRTATAGYDFVTGVGSNIGLNGK